MQNQTTLSLKVLLRTFKSHERLGYNMYAVMKDGCVVCPYCVREEYRTILAATRADCRTGWEYYGCDINYEDAHLYCDHCSGQIPPAYGNAQ